MQLDECDLDTPSPPDARLTVAVSLRLVASENGFSSTMWKVAGLKLKSDFHRFFTKRSSKLASGFMWSAEIFPFARQTSHSAQLSDHKYLKLPKQSPILASCVAGRILLHAIIGQS